MNTSTQGYKQVSRDRFLAQNITVADKRKLGKDFLDRKERARKRKQKKKGGFQVGNTLYARSSVVRILLLLFFPLLILLAHIYLLFCVG
jgi:hypothetical protein